MSPPTKKLEVKVNRTSFLCGNRKLLTDIKTRNQENKDTQQNNNTKTKKITNRGNTGKFDTTYTHNDIYLTAYFPGLIPASQEQYIFQILL